MCTRGLLKRIAESSQTDPRGHGTRSKKIRVDPSTTDDSEGNYIVIAGEELDGGRYTVISVLGKGSFGVVVRAEDNHESVPVAIKIIKNRPLFYNQARVELSILEKMDRMNPEGNHNVVRCLGHFLHKEHMCIVFELLSQNLYELLSLTKFSGLSLTLLQRFAQQILRGLLFLSQPDVAIVHCDLKPENVLLCNAQQSCVKIIDFGSSAPPGAGQGLYKYVQSRYYRAPEVMLGLPYSHPIDMWSLGCMLTELFTGTPPFEGSCEIDQLVKIAQVLGPPPHHMITKRTKYPRAFLVSPSGFVFAPALKMRQGVSLSEMLHSNKPAQPELESFIDLLEHMLVYDPEQRITPRQALDHPFITGGSVWQQSPETPLSDQTDSDSSPRKEKGSDCQV